MNDVTARLRHLADGVAAQHADGPGLPVERLVRRARARRAARATLSVSAAAVVVLAVALGSQALGRDTSAPPPAGPPPAASTPAALPTPTAPTPDAVRLPAADPTRAFGECGALDTAPPRFPPDPVLVLEHAAVPSSVPAGSPLRVEVSLGADDEGTLAVPAAGPRVVVTRDGVVVATDDVYAGARHDWVPQAGWVAVRSHLGTVALVVCPAPGASAGAPLPAGTYAVWFQGDAAPTDAALSDVDPAAAADPAAGLRRSVVAGPFPLTVEPGDAATAAPVPAVLDTTAPSFPVAGAAPPATPTTSSPWRFRHTATTLEMTATDAARSDGAAAADGWDATGGVLTYQGPGRVELDLDLTVASWLVRDGRVVGTNYAMTDATTGLLDLGPGTGRTLLPSSRGFAACETYAGTDLPCTAGTDPVPPGSYTLLPGVVVHGGAVWTRETGPRSFTDVLGAGGPYVVLGDPVPLVLR